MAPSLAAVDTDGLFSAGLNPALDVVLEGESFDSQCEAAFALARAGRYLGEAKYTARARQAVLVLLAGTKVDPADPGVRFPVDPGRPRRAGAAAFLVQAVAELPEPGAELLDQSEQLCQYLRKQQEPDGSFRLLEPASEADASHRFSGQALTAILRSRQQRPAAWKAEAARKALAFYRARWNDQPGLAFAAGHSAACAEAYLFTKEKGFADLAFEMNDWLCGQQYGVETRQPLWRGGFAEGSKASNTPPTIRSLLAAASLVEGCRVARQAGDVQRFNRYQDCLQRGLRFLMTLQYTPANVQHFAESYQPRVAGAFFSSHQNGNVTTDATAQAVLTFTAYLEQVTQLPARAAQSSR